MRPEVEAGGGPFEHPVGDRDEAVARRERHDRAAVVAVDEQAERQVGGQRHGVDSSLTATLCVGSLRNTRRHGASLLEQAAATNDALLANGCGPEGERFATALLARLDLRTGELELVNAGHTAPYLARDGQVSLVELPADLPLGLFEGSTYRSTTVPLLPGDRVVIVTDGMLERSASALDLEGLVQQTRGLHPREATRALSDLVIEAGGGVLADDAALLVVDWHGEHGTPRSTVAGADRQPRG